MEISPSPSTRKLAHELGINIEEFAAQLGRTTITRDDLINQGVQVKSQTNNDFSTFWDIDHSKWGPVKTKPLNRTAKVALANLLASHQIIPSVTHHGSGNVERIEKLRTNLKIEGRKITQLAFHVMELAKCLSVFPRFNSSLSSDNQNLILKDYINIGIAVDTPVGLVVPVIRDADRLNLFEVSKILGDFALRGRNRRLRPNELGGCQ